MNTFVFSEISTGSLLADEPGCVISSFFNQFKNIASYFNTVELFMYPIHPSIGNFLSLMILFIPMISRKSPEAKGMIYQIRLPPMTPLLELQFRVPADAAQGKRYFLDSTSSRYGRLMSNGRGHSRLLNMPAEYSTDREISSWGIRPIAVSGWVDVL